jgi:hypothetical protein
MSNYPVLCYAPACGKTAAYKIASRWSDGVTQELKTYFLACPGCVDALFEQAKSKQAACRLAAEETLDPPDIFALVRGSRDRELSKRPSKK